MDGTDGRMVVNQQPYEDPWAAIPGRTERLRALGAIARSSPSSSDPILTWKSLMADAAMSRTGRETRRPGRSDVSALCATIVAVGIWL